MTFFVFDLNNIKAPTVHPQSLISTYNKGNVAIGWLESVNMAVLDVIG